MLMLSSLLVLPAVADVDVVAISAVILTIAAAALLSCRCCRDGWRRSDIDSSMDCRKQHQPELVQVETLTAVCVCFLSS